ncbi:MAG TPA: hypothetical protein DIS72_05840 [Staphylococcus sp.]|nr:LPXTG cell wall anchor domain-containing protein [Mammaliicoccus fleurettii]HCN60596.1 hypothetical protein [Staphylococcus sp.]
MVLPNTGESENGLIQFTLFSLVILSLVCVTTFLKRTQN